MPLIVTLVGFCAKTVTQENRKNRKMETLRMVIEFGKNEVNKWLKHGITPDRNSFKDVVDLGKW
jgi:hypothetical protein